MLRRLLLPALALVLAACTDVEPTAPPLTAEVSLPAAAARGLTVMTRNLFLGGEFDPILDPRDPRPLVVKTREVWRQIRDSNYPERAGAIAREIAAARPHIVGLQEVPIYRTDVPADGPATPAQTLELDFLQILQDSLADYGVSYAVAASNSLTDIELPALSDDFSSVFDIRYTDRDVILVRTDVAFGIGRAGRYSAATPIVVAGMNAAIIRGWTSVEATVGGVTSLFVNTHLETQADAATQVAQAQELVALIDGPLGGGTLPTVLLGDFNSDAEAAQSERNTDTYKHLIDAGFVDAWDEANPHDPGYTSELPKKVGDPVNLSARLDLILVRQNFRAAPAAGVVGGVHADVVGEEPSDITARGHYPSDHAGVVAILRMPAALARR